MGPEPRTWPVRGRGRTGAPPHRRPPHHAPAPHVRCIALDDPGGLSTAARGYGDTARAFGRAKRLRRRARSVRAPGSFGDAFAWPPTAATRALIPSRGVSSPAATCSPGGASPRAPTGRCPRRRSRPAWDRSRPPPRGCRAGSSPARCATARPGSRRSRPGAPGGATRRRRSSGDADGAFRTADRDRFAKPVPVHRIVDLPGAEHLIQETAPEEIAAEIAAAILGWRP